MVAVVQREVVAEVRRAPYSSYTAATCKAGSFARWSASVPPALKPTRPIGLPWLIEPICRSSPYRTEAELSAGLANWTGWSPALRITAAASAVRLLGLAAANPAPLKMKTSVKSARSSQSSRVFDPPQTEVLVLATGDLPQFFAANSRTSIGLEASPIAPRWSRMPPTEVHSSRAGNLAQIRANAGRDPPRADLTIFPHPVEKTCASLPIELCSYLRRLARNDLGFRRWALGRFPVVLREMPMQNSPRNRRRMPLAVEPPGRAKGPESCADVGRDRR